MFFECKILKNKCTKGKYNIITPEIVTMYKSDYRKLMKKYENHEEVLSILYKKVKLHYKEQKCNDYKFERMHIKTKLGSYLSGGCGIGPSLMSSLIGSSLFTYINSTIRRLRFSLILIYCSLVTALCIYMLTIQDEQVEMYNLFLEILEDIEKENKNNDII